MSSLVGGGTNCLCSFYVGWFFSFSLRAEEAEAYGKSVDHVDRVVGQVEVLLQRLLQVLEGVQEDAVQQPRDGPQP